MNQCKKILQYMREHPDGITTWEAIREFGCTRLPARIADLRRDGCMISKEIQTSKNRYGDTVCFARYRLETDRAEQDH